MGITNSDHVVLYDALGIFSAPRAWWTFKVFGHNAVSVLDGGFPKWIKEGLPIETSKPKAFEASFSILARMLDSKTDSCVYIQPQSYHATFRPEMVIDFKNLFEQVSDFTNPNNGLILDARPAPRYSNA